jgi:chaperonin GroES
MNEKNEGTRPQGDNFEYEETIIDNIGASFNIDDLMSSINIAEMLEDEQLDSIACEVVEGYNLDKNSRTHREDSMRLAQNFALGVPETAEKNFPWPQAANVVYPLISNASITFAGRAYPALLNDDNVVKAQVIGDDDGIPARDQIGGIIPDISTGQPVINPETGQPVIDPLTGQPQIDPATVQPMWIQPPGAKEARGDRVSTFMNWQFCEEMEEWEEDTDRLLHALPVTGNMFRKVYWDVEKERIATHLVYPVNLIVNYKSPSLDRAPRVTEEMEYYPNEIETMIRSGIWLDGEYMSQDSDEMEEESEREENVNDSKDSFSPHVFLEQLTRLDLDGDGYAEPYIVKVHKGSSKVVRIVANYKEDNIFYNDEGVIRRIDPEAYFVHYPFIPSPDGSIYALGFGEILLQPNKTINTLMNQLLDAGKLANTSSGLVGRGLKMKSGSIRFKMGEYKPVDTRGGNIRDNFVQIQHREPSAVLFNLLGLIIEAGKEVGGLRDILMGEQVANQSGITALAHIEQGLTAYKAIHKRIAKAISREIKIVYRLNGQYLNDEQYANVLDAPVPVSRLDFEQNEFNIVPAANPQMVSDMQRLARVQYLDTLRQDPYTNQIELRERIFNMTGIEKPEKLITEPPPPPPNPLAAAQEALAQAEMMKAETKAREAEIKAAEAQAKAEVEGMKAAVQVREAAISEDVIEQDILKKEAETEKIEAETSVILSNVNNRE